jgi:hypothetical protein
VGEVGLGDSSWLVDLGKEDLFLGAVLSFPDDDLALEGAELTCLVAPGVLLREEREERGRLESRVALDLGGDPEPVLLKGIGRVR